MRISIRAVVLLCGLCLAANVSSRPASLIDESILEAVRVVDDPDGYVNVRSGPSRTSKIVAKVSSGGVVVVEAALEGEWARLTSDQEGEPPRYAHASRLTPITSWRQAAATQGDEGKEAVFHHEGFEVQVSRVPFEESGRAITRDEHGLQLVDGTRPWGRDGGLPEESLVLTVKNDGRKVDIPEAATRDLFEPNLDSMVVLTPSDPSEHALVLMANSDGAGAYCVIWAFEKGRYRGRVVYNPF